MPAVLFLLISLFDSTLDISRAGVATVLRVGPLTGCGSVGRRLVVLGVLANFKVPSI